jgi:hypothetical protein
MARSMKDLTGLCQQTVQQLRQVQAEDLKTRARIDRIIQRLEHPDWQHESLDDLAAYSAADAVVP